MTQAKKDRILSAVRTLVTAAGSFIAGKALLGTTVDENLWLGISSAILAVISTVWGIFDKSVKQEMVQSTLRSVVTIFGPIAVGAGWIRDETVQYIMLSISTLLPIIWSNSETTNNQNIASGKTPIANLKGVDEKKAYLITPTITEESKTK